MTCQDAGAGEQLEVQSRSHSFALPFNNRIPTYVCQIGYGLKKKLDGVYIGDGVSNKTDKHFYLPLAFPADLSTTQILKIDNHGFIPLASMAQKGGRFFSFPNSMSVSSDKVFAMFGNPELLILDQDLQVKSRKNYDDAGARFTAVLSLKATADGGIYMLIMKERRPHPPEKEYYYSLVIERGQRTEISLDAVPGLRGGSFGKAPAWVDSSVTFMNPMAVSPDGNRVAIGIEGGLIIIDVPSRKNQVVGFTGAKRGQTMVTPTTAGDIVFSTAQNSILCVHNTSDSNGVMVSRITLNDMKKDSILLPAGEGGSLLTSDTSKVVSPGEKKKVARALSIALDTGELCLFVSHGRTIMRVFLGFEMRVLPWRETVELPCRLIQVKLGPTFKPFKAWVNRTLYMQSEQGMKAMGAKWYRQRVTRPISIC